MGNMGSKLRRGRQAYEQQKFNLAEAVRVQESYVRDYKSLKSMGPKENLNIKSVLTSTSRYGDSYATGFSFMGYTDKMPNSGTHARRNSWWYGVNYRPKSSYDGLLEGYKSAAIGAELGGIATAKKAQASQGPMDLSYIRSARGKSGSSSTPKKNAAGFYISSASFGSDAGITGVTASNTPKDNFNQSYKDAGAYGVARQAENTKEGKAAIDAKWKSDIQSSYFDNFGLSASKELKNKLKPLTDQEKINKGEDGESGWLGSTFSYLGVLPPVHATSEKDKALAVRQQTMLDESPDTGFVMFGLDGRVSAAPKSGKIDWSQFDGMTEEKKKQVKGDIANILVERDIASQLSEQLAKEKALDKKIGAMESNIYFYNAVEDAPPATPEYLAGIGGSHLFTKAVDDTDQINKDSISIYGVPSGHRYPEGFFDKDMPGIAVAKNQMEAKTVTNIYEVDNYASKDYTAIEKYSKIRQSIPDDDPELKQAVDKRWQQKLSKSGSESGKPINWGKFLASEKLSGYEEDLNALNLEKKSLLEKRTMIGNAVSSVGRNELFTKLYESDTFDDSISGLMTINTDQDRDRQINIMKTMSQEQESIKASISTLSKLETKLKRLNQLKKKGGRALSTSNWNKQRDEVYDEIRSSNIGITINNDMKITDVKKAIGKISTSYSDEFKSIKTQKNDLALKISKNSTNTQRLELAESTNKTAQSKQGIEKMIGYSLSGETPSEIKSQWDETFVGQHVSGQQGMSSGKIILPSKMTDEQKKNEAIRKKNEAMRTWKSMGLGSESGWNQNWIGGGGRDLMRSEESINLLTGGKIDQTKLGKLQSDAVIIKKYDSWDQAEDYIGGSITEYKDDIKKTYKKSHKVGHVSDATIATSWFGKSTVEGESWTLNIANNLGVREGLYAGQDIGKIVKTSERYSSTIKNEIDLKKKELIVLREKRRLLQESHNALVPLIDQQVQKDYKAGGKNLDKSLVKKLSTSSESLYDLNYEISEHQVAQTYYEKSLIKTDRDIEKYKKIKKQVDFQTVQGITSGGMINRITRSGSYGRSQANRFRRNTGVRRKTVRGGINKRRGLGGLVT